MSSRILKYLIGSVATFLVVWAGFIAWWQHAHILPSYGDIVIALVAFPLVILVGFVVLNKTIDTARRHGGPALPALSSPGPEEAESPSDSTAGYCLRMLASRILTPAGTDGDSVWSFLSESQSKQELDPDLLADEGISAFLAKVSSLNVAAARQFLADSDLREQHVRQWGAADLRTLQLLFELAEEMIPECCARLAALKADADRKTSGTRLFVKVFVPADWEPFRCGWVSGRLEQLFALADGGETASGVSMHGVSSGIDVLKAIDNLNVELNSDGTDDLFLVLAAESALEPERIRRWHTEGVILGSGRRGEMVPGEGAAGVLLQANVVQPRGAPAHTALLRRLAVGRRDGSGKKHGNMNADVLEAVASEAIVLAGLQKSDAAAFVFDADRRGAQQAEVMRLVSVTYPHVEVPANAVSVGTAAGSSCVPLALIALCLAHSHSEAAEQPTMVLSVQDDHERGAAVICPSLQQEYA